MAVMRPVRSAPCWQWMRNGPFSVFFSMLMTSMTCLSPMRQVRIFVRSVRSDVPFDLIVVVVEIAQVDDRADAELLEVLHAERGRLLAAIERGRDAMQVGHAFERDGLGPMRGRAPRRPAVSGVAASCADDRRGEHGEQTAERGMMFHMEPDDISATTSARRLRTADAFRRRAHGREQRAIGEQARELEPSVAPSTALMAAPDSSR